MPLQTWEDQARGFKTGANLPETRAIGNRYARAPQ